MNIPLIEKYRARNIKDIKGQDSAIQEIEIFLKTFPRKRALILNGPAGSGKTSLALAFAREKDLELFELNASDLRNRSKLDEILKPALMQDSIFKKGKLILMDEADGITGSDRGGVAELILLISKSNFPIIITANDIWDKKFNLLRQKCQIVTLKELKEDVLMEIAKEICLKENQNIPENLLKIIVKKSGGDVRSLLNDLQSIFKLEEEFMPVSESEIGDREKQDTIFNALKKVFQSPTTEDIINVYDRTEMDLDEIMLWVEENIPVEYKGQALAKAFDSLSKADIFKGRIYRQQHWRFLIYQNFFLSAGISASTKLKYSKFNQYKKPSRILQIWLSNQKHAKKRTIASKYAKFSHMSKRKAMKENFFLPLIISKDDEKNLDLEKDEVEYLKEKKGAIIVSQNLNRFKI